MQERSAGRMRWLCGAMLVTLMLANGCQSTSTLPPPLAKEGSAAPQQRTGANKTNDAARSKNGIVAPGMELQWSIQTAVEQPGLLRSGQSNVGPDGTMVIGPYGICQVAGLTLDQAARQVEKKLSAYVKQPRVVMRTVTPSTAAKEVVWKKSTLSGGAGMARSSPVQPMRQGEPIRAAEFQPLPLSKDMPVPMPTVPEKEALPPLKLLP